MSLPWALALDTLTRTRFNSPASLSWKPIVEDGEVVGVICPDLLTLQEQRSIRAEQARIMRRLKPGCRCRWGDPCREAGYWAGDVAGERRACPAGIRGVQP